MRTVFAVVLTALLLCLCTPMVCAAVPLASDPGGFATAFVYSPGGVGFGGSIRAEGTDRLWKRGGVAATEFLLDEATAVRFAVGLPKGGALRVDGELRYTAIADQRVPDATLTPVRELSAGVHTLTVQLPASAPRWPGPGFFVRVLDAEAKPMPVAWRLPTRRVQPESYLTGELALGFMLGASAPAVPVWRARVTAALQVPSDVVGDEVPVCVLGGGDSWPRTAGKCTVGPGAVCELEVPWSTLGRGKQTAVLAVGTRCQHRLVGAPPLHRDDVAAAVKLHAAVRGHEEDFGGVRFDLQALEDLARVGGDDMRPARLALGEVTARLRSAARDLSGHSAWKPGPNLRAYRSPLDGRWQPYTVVLPRSWTANQKDLRRWLVVGLHGHGGTPWSMCRAMTGSAGQWVPDDAVVVCPYGHGDLAFRYAGRRDLFEVMRRVRREFAVDPARVHLVGVSDGGLAALEVGLDHPDWFASVLALAAGGDMRAFGSIGRTGHKSWETVWLDAVSPVVRAPAGAANVDWLLVYGGKDRFPEAARSMASALRASGASVELREHPEAGHNVWSRTFEGGAAFAWMKPRRKKARGGVAPEKTGPHMDDAGGVVGCTPGPEALDRVRDLSMTHVYATGDPAQTALYRYLARLDSERWGRRVYLERKVISDASLTPDNTDWLDRSVVLVGTPTDHAAIRRLVPSPGELFTGLRGDVGVRALRRPVGLAHGCPRVLVLATGTSARGVSFANHLPEILPSTVWTDARGVLPPFGQVLGSDRNYIRAD